jgi:hypothetical protein
MECIRERYARAWQAAMTASPEGTQKHGSARRRINSRISDFRERCTRYAHSGHAQGCASECFAFLRSA